MATQTLTLLFGRKAAKVGELQFDATIRESHKYNAEITDFPVEEGFDVNDNIRKLPERYEMEGIVTNAPIVSVFNNLILSVVKGDSNSNEARVNSRAGEGTFVEVAQNLLLDLAGRRIQGKQENGIPKIFEIVTGLRVYKNMAIETLEFPRDGQTGQALRANITFKRINTTETETIAIPNPQDDFKDTTQSNQKKGKIDKKEATAEQTKKVSTLKKAGNRIASFFTGGGS